MNPLTVPPSNVEAERGVLGGILRDPDTLPSVQEHVVVESFYFDAHQKIFRALCELGAKNQPIDLVLLSDKLRKNKHLEDVGGSEYLVEMWDSVPTGANVSYHAKLVRDAALFRSLIRAANEILRDAYSPASSADELIALAERRLFAIAADLSEDTEPRSVGDIARERLNALDERIASGDALSGLSTGYEDLDRFIGGLRPGELIVLGARLSLGKTAMSLNIAERVASSGVPTLFFSLEQSADDITDRMLSMESGVPMHRMSRPRDLDRDDIDALFNATHTGLAGMPLYIEDTPHLSAARVAAISRRQCRRRGVRLIVVDYLALLQPENMKDNQTLRIGTLALRMKNMARALNVPTILLCQLNREVEGANRAPRLSDLRDSGEIEQHADRVLLLHREPNLSPDDPIWPIEAIVAKNRNGPIGSVRLAYRRPCLRFENMAIGG